MGDGLSEGDIQRVVRSVFASRHFAHARSLRRILEYICTHAHDPSSPSIKEYEIAVFALGRRPDTFDPKIDPIVRVSMAAIRERLAAYFANEGRGDPFRLSIPKGEYRAVFERATPEATNALEPLLRFWAPHLDGRRSIVLFSEVLFFVDGAGTFVRNAFVNDPRDLHRMKDAFPGADLDTFAPSFHFVPAGEMHALLALEGAFAAVGSRIEPRNARFVSWSDLADVHVVVLGSVRTNPLVAALPWNGRWRITDRTIVDVEAPTVHGARRTNEGSLARRTEPALVRRLSHPCGPGCVTLITANHGRAIEGAADRLARVDRLDDVLGRIDSSETAFELLFEVDMIGTEDEVVSVELLDHAR